MKFSLKPELFDRLHHGREALRGCLELIRCQNQHGCDARLQRHRSRMHSRQDLQASRLCLSQPWEL